MIDLSQNLPEFTEKNIGYGRICEDCIYRKGNPHKRRICGHCPKNDLYCESYKSTIEVLAEEFNKLGRGHIILN